MNSSASALQKHQDEVEAIEKQLALLKFELENTSPKEQLAKRTEIGRLESGPLQKALIKLAFAKAQANKHG